MHCSVHRATRVPVGEDQLQHIQLAQHLAKLFNNKYGFVFPRPSAVIYGDHATSETLFVIVATIA